LPVIPGLTRNPGRSLFHGSRLGGRDDKLSHGRDDKLNQRWHANDALVRQYGLVALLMKALDWTRPAPMPPEERAALMAEWADPERAFAMLNWYRASKIEVPPLEAPYALPAGYTPIPIPKITIPTLVVWALEDEALPPGNIAQLSEWVEDLAVTEVTDCGHFVPWEAPTAVNRAMEGFLLV